MLSITTDSAFSFNTAVELRPSGVAYPRDAREVVAALRYARDHGLRVAPQATGHNVSANGALDDALLVDVRNRQDVSIDPRAHRVRVGAGVKWERVAPLLSEHGVAGLHGSSPDVGIAGYSLGGGMGWLARRYGLQANSATAIELVLADGRHIRTDATYDPDDVFRGNHRMPPAERRGAAREAAEWPRPRAVAIDAAARGERVQIVRRDPRPAAHRLRPARPSRTRQARHGHGLRATHWYSAPHVGCGFGMPGPPGGRRSRRRETQNLRARFCPQFA